MGVQSQQKCFQVKLWVKKEGGRSFGGGRTFERVRYLIGQYEYIRATNLELTVCITDNLCYVFLLQM